VVSKYKIKSLKEKANISDIYRRQVDDLIDRLPDAGFIAPLDQQELDGIWEEISIEMEIDEIWNDISSDLDDLMPPHADFGIFLKSLAIALIILIGMFPVKKALMEQDDNKTENLIKAERNEQISGLNLKNNAVKSNMEEKVKRDITPVFENSSDSDGSDNSIILIEAENKRLGLAKEISGSENKAVYSSKLPSSGIALSEPGISQDKVVPENSDTLQEVSIVNPVIITSPYETDPENLIINNNILTNDFLSTTTGRERISIGLVALFKNTWLLNHETFDGFRSESLNTTEIVFFPDVGLVLDCPLNTNWSLKADAFFYSGTGQDYMEYIYGHYSKKTIILRYSTVSLSVKYRLNGRGSFMNRSSINLLAGNYLSVLQNASQEINSDQENIKSQYKKLDFGVRLGCEIEFNLLDHLSIAPGLFMSMGMPNIYKGYNNIPGYLRKTYNGSEGFLITFYYHFY
jgi:hypothetical protein